MHRTLPEDLQARICYTGTTLALGTKFNNIKHPIKKSNQDNVVYSSPCRKRGCVEDYFGETS